MTSFSPKTVRGKLLFAYLALIACFSASGLYVLLQFGNLRTSSQEFFGAYTQAEETIIASRFLVDELSNSVLAPFEIANVEDFLEKALYDLEDTKVLFENSILPESQRLEVADLIDEYAMAVASPIMTFRDPISVMEEADALAERCMHQAERINKSALINAIAGMVDSYTDVLLTNNQQERERFDKYVNQLERHASYSAITSFPEFKQKALEVFWSNTEYQQARQEFRQTSYALAEKLVEVDKQFHADFLLPRQQNMATNLQYVSWLVFASLVLAILLSTLVSIVLARRIWRPLQDMGDMVVKLGQGELNHRLNTTSEDEMAEIGSAMNAFAEQLKENMERLDNQMVEMSMVEANLRMSEEYSRNLSKEYQVVFDGISESLVVVNKERNIVWSNKQASEEFFSEIDRKVAATDYDLDADSSFYLGVDQVDLCFNTGEKVEDLIQVSTDQYYRVKVFPLSNEEGEIDRVLKIINDVSEQYLMNEEANRSNRLASLGELSAGVAHEINNPNSLVIVNSPIVRDVFEDILPILDDYQKEKGDFELGGLSYQRLKYDLPLMLKEMHEGSLRIQRIVEDLKNFVRKEGNVLFEKIDINIAVETGVRLVKGMINKSTNNFTLDPNKRLPLITGNSIQIEQIVVNLVQNACLALPDRDRGLTVRTKLSEDSDFVILSVRDEGVGIPPENVQRITDPFFTTRRQKGGTGLGLSVTKRIVNDHNGIISFDSVLGEWTEVTVKFPVLN